MRRLFLTFMLLLALAAGARTLTVVIDAGHGGHDIGAPGTDINEKSVNLAVARNLGDALKKHFKDGIKVIYTRSNDTFVKLAERAEIANRANASLFVSIHCNSIADSRRRNQVSGASVYVRGFASSKQANEVAALENSVLELEDNTKIDISSEESILSDLKWNRNLDESISLASHLLDELVESAGRRRGAVEQNDLAVLRRTRMPAVLVELDYICNDDIASYLASDAGQNRLAQALCNGIVNYTSASQKKVSKPKQPTSPEKPRRQEQVRQTPADSSATVYKIQFMTSNRTIAAGSSRFKGLDDVDSYRDGAVVKYTTGSFATMAEATNRLKEVRRLFPDAFIITMKNGRRVK